MSDAIYFLGKMYDLYIAGACLPQTVNGIAKACFSAMLRCHQRKVACFAQLLMRSPHNADAGDLNDTDLYASGLQ